MAIGTRYPTATTLAGKYRQIYEGRAERTRSGLTKKDLKVSKSGKIVSKRASRAAKARQEPLTIWRLAVTEAARELEVDYTIPKKGTVLYRAARRNYDDMLACMSEAAESDSESECESDESSEESEEFVECA